ncbi:hypothetical protein COL154_014070, partial [Colletotrichum chrysophilum]
MVVHDRLRDVLQHHGLAGLGLADDEAALALADRRDQVEDAAGDVFGGTVAALQVERLAREQRRQVLEQQLVLGRFRRIAVDVVDLQQREIAFALLRMTHAAGEVVAGAQVEAADLGWRHVDVVGTGEVGLVGRAQEAEAVLQDFQHAFGPDAAAGLGVGAQDVEDHVLLAGARDAFLDAQFLGQLQQLHRVLLLELGEVDQALGIAGIGFVAGDIGGQAIGIATLPVAAARMAPGPAAAAFGPVAALLGLPIAAIVAGGGAGFGSRVGRAGVIAL